MNKAEKTSLFVVHNTVAANQRVLPVDWDQFYPLLQEILKRMPMLKNVFLENLTNTPEAFSPDCKWIIGETPEVRIYSVSLLNNVLKSLKFVFRSKIIW